MTSQATLTSAGWTGWATVRDLLGEDPCLWADLGGLHAVVPAPARVPVGATHLWSWRPGRWVRVRVEAHRALATVLTPGSAPGGVAVTYTSTGGITWGGHERAAACHFTVELLRTEGRAPVTFIASCAPSAPGA